jgi:hypothetical protein
MSTPQLLIAMALTRLAGALVQAGRQLLPHRRVGWVALLISKQCGRLARRMLPATLRSGLKNCAA